MSQDPNSTAAPKPPVHLSKVRITVAGLGVTMTQNARARLDGDTLSCVGTVSDGQAFDPNGGYDIYSTEKNYSNVVFTGGSGTSGSAYDENQDDPWTFDVSRHRTF